MSDNSDILKLILKLHAASSTLVMFDLAAATARLLIYVTADGILSSGEVEKIKEAIRLLREALEAAIGDGGPNSILPGRKGRA